MATVSLAKGQKVSLTKETPGLNKVIVGLGWDPVGESTVKVTKKPGFFGKLLGAKERVVEETTSGEDIDCDAFAVAIDSNGNVISTLYYGKKNLFNNTLVHSGDNLTGEGEGDDEQIIVKLSELPKEVEKIIVAVNIYRGRERNQRFGNIANAFIRIVNASNDQEMCKYELSDNDEYSDVVTVHFGDLVRSDNGWAFNAVGEPSKADSINEFVQKI